MRNLTTQSPENGKNGFDSSSHVTLISNFKSRIYVDVLAMTLGWGSNQTSNCLKSLQSNSSEANSI